MICTRCQHESWNHTIVTYPVRREPCAVCLNCGNTPSIGKACCANPRPCRCANFERRAA